MNEEIHIRRCSIAVVRRDASALWADRATNREVAKKAQAMVLAALDVWLAPLLAGRAAGHEAIGEIRIDVTLDPTDLTGAAPLVRGRVRDKLVRAVAGAAVVPAEASPILPPRREAAGAVAPPDAKGAAPVESRCRAGRRELLPLLAAAFEEGWLGYRLALMRAPAVLELAAVLLAEAGEMAPESSALPEDWRRMSRSAWFREALAEMRAAIMAVARASNLRDAAAPDEADRAESGGIARLGSAVRQLSDLIVQRHLDHHAEGEPLALTVAKPEKRDAVDEGAGTVRETRSPAVLRPPEVSVEAAQLATGRYACDSLLPFLMLQPLARHRLFEGMEMADADAAVFAQALALMLPGTQRSARLFGNAARDCSGAQLLSAARRVSGAAAVSAVNAGALLLAGHGEGQPLLALVEGDGLLIVERDGLGPIALLEDDDLEAFAEGNASPLFLASEDRGLLARLDAAGLGALCAGAPGRGETWPAVRGPGGWTGMTSMTPPRAAAAARRVDWLEDGIDRARETWRTLQGAAIPVPARAAAGIAALRHSLALLAGFALSEIGVAMARPDPASWADPDPLLVIERFVSLSGEILVEPARVTVTLPLGRRFTDLRDAGLLATLGGVPWWGGRRIDFAGG